MIDNIDVLDSVIIGSGPAGITASIYMSRACLKFVLITGEAFGGQMIDSNNIYNYIGYNEISGYNLAKLMMKQMDFNNVVRIVSSVCKINISDGIFALYLSNNQYLYTKTVLICSGSNHKALGLSNEKQILWNGLYTCVLCETHLCMNKNVLIIGGGNSGVESSIYLSNIASKIYLIHRHNKLKADKILVHKISSICNVSILLNNTILSIILDDNGIINSVLLKDNTVINVDIIFNNTGMTPNTDFVRDLLNLTYLGYIIVDESFCTSVNGIYAAGEVIDPVYKQIMVSCGQGCAASIEIIRKLNI